MTEQADLNNQTRIKQCSLTYMKLYIVKMLKFSWVLLESELNPINYNNLQNIFLKNAEPDIFQIILIFKNLTK